MSRRRMRSSRRRQRRRKGSNSLAPKSCLHAGRLTRKRTSGGASRRAAPPGPSRTEAGARIRVDPRGMVAPSLSDALDTAESHELIVREAELYRDWALSEGKRRTRRRL